MVTITAEDLAALKAYDTPTICNALEIVAPSRRATGFTTRPLICRDPSMPPMVGFARTATIRSLTPASPAVAARREPYYEYVAKDPLPSISVIQDLDPIPGFGAFWGEVNTAIHKGLGCEGVVTDGSIRDLDQCAPGFQLLAGMVAPSHAHVHVEDFGCDVNIYGMAVSDGDIIHADRHGAVVIPTEVLKDIAGAVDLLVRREAVVLACARAEDFDIHKLKKAMANAREIH
ncbi:MAG: RraA family protein [Burkholderiaceae bacterium]|nr:RraA family protein [Burkholderiaceae bacterium]